MDNKKSNLELAQEFLQYVANNTDELKAAVKKNITNDKELFDDCFSETIIKVYNSIAKNGTKIDDIKQYFFLACKFTFFYRQNKKRKEEAKAVRDFFDYNDFEEDVEDSESKFKAITEALSIIKEDIKEKYGEFNSEVFFDYYHLKANQHISYKKLAAAKGISTRRVAEIINAIKKYIATSDEIQKYKEIFTEEY